MGAAVSADGGRTDAATRDSGGSDAGPLDAGSPDGGPPPCSAAGPCSGPYNYAFLSSELFEPSAFASREGIDAECTRLAAAAGLPGTYVAWLSYTAEDAINRLGDASGWLRTDGMPFAPSAESLVEGRPIRPLDLDENGVRVTGGESWVVTGTRSDGTLEANFNCEDWTNVDTSAMRALAGFTYRAGSRWTSGYSLDCNARSRVYCFGVDHTDGIPVVPVEGRLAFVLDSPVQPDMGIARFDAACAEEASAAGLSGSFRALVGTPTASPISRFDLDGPTWVRVDGAPVWAAAADAAANMPPLTPMFLSATGRTVSRDAWFGSDALNSTSGAFCETGAGPWTTVSADVEVRVMDTSSTDRWLYPNSFGCTRGGLTGAVCLQE